MSSLVQRMLLNDPMVWLPAISFGLVFLVFLMAVVRACTAPRKRIDHLASLPFSDEKGDHHV